ncbi:hypothetical protein IIA94_02515, partial [Patescibacteria group bacterium]|nr:hypothetical protein [Patescibacteria group bacterium]
MIKISIYLFLVFLLLPVGAEAAEFRLESDLSNIGVGDEFLVTLQINTQGESINALEGEVVFPEESLELQTIQEKGSIVNLWIEGPHGKQGIVAFSGLTPGGYRGEGVIFSLVFKAKTQGTDFITIEKAKALLNDGQGSPDSVTTLPFQFFVSTQSLTPRTLDTQEEDKEPPEPFDLRVAQDSTIFDGQNFLVFATQDKSSGVDYYEVSFARKGETTSWERAVSPFLLEQYDEIKEIRVKAVD